MIIDSSEGVETQICLPISVQNSIEIEQNVINSQNETNQSNHEKSDELSIVSVIKKPIRKRKIPLKKVTFIVQPLYNLKPDRKFLIRGDLVIDVDYLRQNMWKGEGCNQAEFRSASSVNWRKDTRFFEIEFQKSQLPIRDFSFLIEMFNSLGDVQCHQVALELQEYYKFFVQFDQARKSNHHAIKFGETPIQSFHQSSIGSMPTSKNWTFEDSLEKAYNIIKERSLQKDKHKLQVNQIFQGNGQREILFLSEQVSRIFFGDASIEVQTKHFLTNRKFQFETSILDLIKKKKCLFEYYLKSLLNNDPNQIFKSTTEEKIHFFNNIVITFTIEMERIPLSNYSDNMENDFLIMISVSRFHNDQIYDSNFLQKNHKETHDHDEQLAYDFSYSMMSEHFVEKFYGDGKDEAQHKVPTRLERVQDKKKHIRMYHQHINQNKSKTCGYKPINQNLNQQTEPINVCQSETIVEEISATDS